LYLSDKDRLFGQGAEARLYGTRIFGADLVVKSREPKAYRIKELDTRLRVQRTRNEARLMQRAYAAGVRVPRLIGLGRFSIYMERLDGRLLKDVKINEGQAEELGQVLARLHHANIAHGDFTTANIMSTRKGLYVIDFGLASSDWRLEEKAIDLLLMKRSLSGRLYAGFAKAYLKNSDEGREVMKRLAEIEKRGRYQSRTLA
jgi:Kae1-associated kinase Bud32